VSLTRNPDPSMTTRRESPCAPPPDQRSNPDFIDKNHACCCGTAAAHSQAVAAGGEVSIRERYLVDGITCSHCVTSVTAELSALERIETVSVDRNAGGAARIMIVSSTPAPVDDVRAAISAAGSCLVAI
jgi:copper chaperone